MFSTGDTGLGLTDLGATKIKLLSDSPVVYRPYRLSLYERELVKKKVEDLLTSGVIRESESAYASPTVLIPKKNGDVRMCVDYRALNKLTVKDRFPLLRVDDQLDRLAGKCFYSMLDLAQGYHQVVTPDGHYECLRVPFGLTNAPAIFQRVVNKMLKEAQGDEVLAYMDDILIPSTTVSHGLYLLRSVQGMVKKAGLKLNLEKCSF